MDKDKQKLIILGALVLFFIIILATRGGKHKPSIGTAPTVTPTAVVRPKIEAAGERKVSAFKSWGRDPFAVGGATTDAGGDLILTGIIWDEKRPYCIINGRLSKKGDEIFGCVILEIKKDSVTVKVGDEIRILRIGGRQ